MYAVDLILKLLEQVERADKEGLLTPKYLNENISGERKKSKIFFWICVLFIITGPIVYYFIVGRSPSGHRQRILIDWGHQRSG